MQILRVLTITAFYGPEWQVCIKIFLQSSLIFVFLAYTYACFGEVRGLVEGMNTPMPVINEYLLPDFEGSRLATM